MSSSGTHRKKTVVFILLWSWNKMVLPSSIFYKTVFCLFCSPPPPPPPPPPIDSQRFGGNESKSNGKKYFKIQNVLQRNDKKSMLWCIFYEIFHIFTINLVNDTLLWTGQHSKSFVATNIVLSRQSFVMTSILLLWQKTCFVTTNVCVMTNMLRQKFCCDKNYTCGSSHQWYSKTTVKLVL